MNLLDSSPKHLGSAAHAGSAIYPVHVFRPSLIKKTIVNSAVSVDSASQPRISLFTTTATTTFFSSPCSSSLPSGYVLVSPPTQTRKHNLSLVVTNPSKQLLSQSSSSYPQPCTQSAQVSSVLSSFPPENPGNQLASSSTVASLAYCPSNCQAESNLVVKSLNSSSTSSSTSKTPEFSSTFSFKSSQPLQSDQQPKQSGQTPSFLPNTFPPQSLESKNGISASTSMSLSNAPQIVTARVSGVKNTKPANFESLSLSTSCLLPQLSNVPSVSLHSSSSQSSISLSKNTIPVVPSDCTQLQTSTQDARSGHSPHTTLIIAPQTTPASAPSRVFRQASLLAPTSISSVANLSYSPHDKLVTSFTSPFSVKEASLSSSCSSISSLPLIKHSSTFLPTRKSSVNMGADKASVRQTSSTKAFRSSHSQASVFPSQPNLTKQTKPQPPRPVIKPVRPQKETSTFLANKTQLPSKKSEESRSCWSFQPPTLQRNANHVARSDQAPSHRLQANLPLSGNDLSSFSSLEQPTINSIQTHSSKSDVRTREQNLALLKSTSQLQLKPCSIWGDRQSLVSNSDRPEPDSPRDSFHPESRVGDKRSENRANSPPDKRVKNSSELGSRYTQQLPPSDQLVAARNDSEWAYQQRLYQEQELRLQKQAEELRCIHEERTLRVKEELRLKEEAEQARRKHDELLLQHEAERARRAQEDLRLQREAGRLRRAQVEQVRKDEELRLQKEELKRREEELIKLQQEQEVTRYKEEQRRLQEQKKQESRLRQEQEEFRKQREDWERQEKAEMLQRQEYEINRRMEAYGEQKRKVEQETEVRRLSSQYLHATNLSHEISLLPTPAVYSYSQSQPTNPYLLTSSQSFQNRCVSLPRYQSAAPSNPYLSPIENQLSSVKQQVFDPFKEETGFDRRCRNPSLTHQNFSVCVRSHNSPHTLWSANQQAAGN